MNRAKTWPRRALSAVIDTLSRMILGLCGVQLPPSECAPAVGSAPQAPSKVISRADVVTASPRWPAYIESLQVESAP